VKSCIIFFNLIRQIEAAVTKGHTEAEITQAVVQAVLPGSSLRGYLEGRPHLSLAGFRGILRGHYRERTVTELYHELGNLTQSSKEEATDYLMQALDLRQKVLFASAETIESPGLTYSNKLSQGMFRHVLFTGFLKDSVRFEFLSTLELPDVTDESLIQAMSQISVREKE
jgi:hypothetical protein